MNTKQKLQEEIREELLRLPKDAQQAINSYDWLSLCEEVGKKNNLSEYDISGLQTETALVLVGLVDPEDYVENIEDNMGIRNALAEKLSREAMQKVFIPIAKKREEIIKENIKNNPPAWDKWMQFVLSGGDYSYLGDKPMAEAVREGMGSGNRVNLNIIK